MSFSAMARYFARESLNAASALDVIWLLAMLSSIGDAFGLSAMNFSSASTRFSGFFSPAAALNATASAGSSWAGAAGFWASPAAVAAGLGAGGFCSAPPCARGQDVDAATRASVMRANRRTRIISMLQAGRRRSAADPSTDRAPAHARSPISGIMLPGVLCAVWLVTIRG